jgi:hypothetical protein
MRNWLVCGPATTQPVAQPSNERFARRVARLKSKHLPGCWKAFEQGTIMSSRAWWYVYEGGVLVEKATTPDGFGDLLQEARP